MVLIPHKRVKLIAEKNASLQFFETFQILLYFVARGCIADV